MEFEVGSLHRRIKASKHLAADDPVAAIDLDGVQRGGNRGADLERHRRAGDAIERHLGTGFAVGERGDDHGQDATIAQKNETLPR